MSDISTLFSTTGITDSERMLHTPGEFAKKNLLYVQEVGRLKSLQPHKSQREKLDSFLILGILSGEGIITIDDRGYEVKEGMCALIDCMNYYAHESSADKPWELIWVHFNGIIAKAYYDLFMDKNNQGNIFKPDNIKDIQDLITELMEFQKEKDLKSELSCGNILSEILNNCLFSVMRKEEDNNNENRLKYKEIREYVNEHYQDSNLVDLFIDKYDIKDTQLKRGFQGAYGITLENYILNRRFTAAKELLRFTAKPLREIIEESGIKNEDLFKTLFLDGEGMSAEEYRMKWSQWVK